MRQGQIFNRTAGLECVGAIWDTINSTSKLAASPYKDYFALNSSGLPDGTISDPRLTRAGCDFFCGTEMGFYPDSGPRLLTWFLPIAILLANFQFSPVGRKRYLSVFHLLGNPIGSTFSLLCKMESWKKSFEQAEQLLRSPQSQETPNYGFRLNRLWKENRDPDPKILLYQTKSLGVLISGLKEVSSYLGHAIYIDTISVTTTPTRGEISQQGIPLTTLATKTQILVTTQPLATPKTQFLITPAITPAIQKKKSPKQAKP